jgi:peptidyl-prolyl cis-trans isomerase C
MKLRASHILVNHLFEAEDILRLLGEGKDFAKLAIQFSKCSSAKEGGDLGFIAPGKMDEDFEEAVLALRIGEQTKKPVRTKFGYHIIKRLS